MRVAVVPFYKSQLKNAFFDDAHASNRDGALEPFAKIKTYFESHGSAVGTVDVIKIKHADRVVFFSLELRYLIQAFFTGKLKNSIYIPFEPPVVRNLHKPVNLNVLAKVFGLVLTWQDELVGTDNFKKFHFPMPDLRGRIQKKPFESKKFITTIVGFKQSDAPNELYSHRIEAIRFFEKRYPETFEFYGMGWDRNEFPSYRGPVENKLEKLSEYKFAICYENECNINGLISEKIFDCFYAGVVPVFWGANNIEDYIPSECYIDKCLYPDYESLCDYLENMGKDEYDKRIASIESYLASEDYARHSPTEFSNNIFECVSRDVTKKILFSDFASCLLMIAKVRVVDFFKKRFSV